MGYVYRLTREEAMVDGEKVLTESTDQSWDYFACSRNEIVGRILLQMANDFNAPIQVKQLDKKTVILHVVVEKAGTESFGPHTYHEWMFITQEG